MIQLLTSGKFFKVEKFVTLNYVIIEHELIEQLLGNQVCFQIFLAVASVHVLR